MHTPRFIIPLNQGEITKAPLVAAFNLSDDWQIDQLGDEIIVEQDNASLSTQLKKRGYEVVERIQGDNFDSALVMIGKHADLNKAIIARAWLCVKEGSNILVEGAKTEGIDSLIRAMKALGIDLNIKPKSHGKIVWFSKKTDSVGNIKSWLRFEEPYENEQGYWVENGIFSPKTIDKGTAFLLKNLPSKIQGKVADFGAGYGVISKHLLQNYPKIESIDLFEVSRKATNCAIRNIDDTRAHVHWLDVSDAPQSYFDFIITNPPFHEGRAGDPSIGINFIECAKNSLHARGKFIMVANRHLPYEKSLKNCFRNVVLLAEDNAFKIYEAHTPFSNK